jgi:hypothetical protein
MKEIILQYEGYLTEQKLIKLFQDLSKEVNIAIETNVKIGKRYRGDLVVNDKYLIEFDGYQHYTNANQFRNDLLKSSIWVQNNFNKIIRIPYFIQLTFETFNYFFKELINELQIKINIIQNFPHGFIDKKAILPANFCSLGIKRFYIELLTLPEQVYLKILESLINILEKDDPIKIFPLGMQDIQEFKQLFNYLINCAPEKFEFYTNLSKNILK